MSVDSEISLSSALGHQREKLGTQLLAHQTLSWDAIYNILIHHVGLQDVSPSLVSHAWIIARLVDNLLDDEWISVEEIISNITPSGEIQEVNDFFEALTPDLHEEFEAVGSRTLKIAAEYNCTLDVDTRCNEWNALAQLYLCVWWCTCDDPNYKEYYSILAYFCITWYMFADLKHVKKDNRSLQDTIKLGIYLIKYGSLFFYYAKNKMKAVRIFPSLILRSIMREFK